MTPTARELAVTNASQEGRAIPRELIKLIAMDIGKAIIPDLTVARP